MQMRTETIKGTGFQTFAVPQVQVNSLWNTGGYGVSMQCLPCALKRKTGLDDMCPYKTESLSVSNLIAQNKKKDLWLYDTL